MKYELWDLICYTEADQLMPFTKIKDSDNFQELYIVFLEKIKTYPCAIIIKS